MKNKGASIDDHRYKPFKRRIEVELNEFEWIDLPSIELVSPSLHLVIEIKFSITVVVYLNRSH